MRCSYSLASLASSCILGVSSAGLAEVTGVTASANGWDTRTTGYGCAPGGCVPANVLDDSIEPASRWSCRPSFSVIEVCELALVFDEPQDIFEIRMALWKGNQRNRTVDIWVDGSLSTSVQSSGSTQDYEAYELSATQATTIVLQEAGAEDDVWLSVTGVKLMTDSEVEVSLPSPSPTSGDFVGCFSDMISDRVLATVATSDSLTPADCAATCGATNLYFYGLQQGNECWCAGCDITERDTNTDFDRHGDGTCTTPCSGDPTSTCGGDMAISLYQTTTCLATPAPTPAFAASGCPSGSIGASLEIIASWDDEFSGLDLHVVEPGGVEVSDRNKLGDVGIWAESREGLNGDSIRRPQTYVTLNGLSAANDAVLGDYKIWGTGGQLTTWTITARSGGEMLWVQGGIFSEFQDETETFTATVTSYAESDCTVDEYGTCPQNTYGPGGLPPCSACAPGLVALDASTYCTVPSLRRLHLPETIANAMIADAVGGWAGPGYPVLDDNRDFMLFVAEGAELGTISVSGTFAREDGAALPASTTLYLYMHNEDSEFDFVRGEGALDPATGNFTATITDFPVGYSKGLLSFVVLDPADAGGDEYADESAFVMDVVNEGCSDALRIKLEWDSHADLDLWVTDPNGDRVSYFVHATDIGYVNDRNGADTVSRNPDTGFNSSFEEYVLFSGLSGDAMLGEYRIFVRRSYAESSVAWTLSATIGGAVEWVEEGVFDGRITTSHSSGDDDDYIIYDDDDDYNTYDDDGGSISSRRLFNPYTTTSYSSSYDPQSDVFTVTLASYNAVGC